MSDKERTTPDLSGIACARICVFQVKSGLRRSRPASVVTTLTELAGCINREHGSQGVRAYSVNPGLVSTEAVTATLGEDGALAQRYGAMSPAAIAASLLWLATDSAAPALARKPTLIQLQDLVREHQLA